MVWITRSGVAVVTGLFIFFITHCQKKEQFGNQFQKVPCPIVSGADDGTGSVLGFVTLTIATGTGLDTQRRLTTGANIEGPCVAYPSLCSNARYSIS